MNVLDGPHPKEAVLGGRIKLLSSSMQLSSDPPHKYNSKVHHIPCSSSPFIHSLPLQQHLSSLFLLSHAILSLCSTNPEEVEFISSSKSSVPAVMTKEDKELEQQGFTSKDYTDPPPAAFFDTSEFKLWSFYRALIAEFIATLLFLYITIATVIGHSRNSTNCGSVGVLGIAWSFGGMIFVLVYCTAGISGGHINPAVTFGLFLARKVSLPRAVLYMIAQCLGAICGTGLVKAFQKSFYDRYGGGANFVHPGYTKGVGLAAEIIGTFVLVYTVFSATDPKRSARDSHVPVLAPLPIGFAVFMVHLATIPITGTGINPARSFGAAVIYGHKQSWNDQWIFWVGPFIGAALAAAYHQYILRAAAIKALGSFRSNPHV